jgi:hypothetical protein
VQLGFTAVKKVHLFFEQFLECVESIEGAFQGLDFVRETLFESFLGVF